MRNKADETSHEYNMTEVPFIETPRNDVDASCALVEG